MSHICSFELVKLFPDDLLEKDTVKVEVPAPALWHLKFNKKKFPLSKTGRIQGTRVQVGTGVTALTKRKFKTSLLR